MSEALRIAVIGDYNFTYNSHHATNLSIDHASRFLEEEINYYWIKVDEAAFFKMENFEKYDGVWIAPGPYKNVFFLNSILDILVQLKIPTLVTGEGYRALIEVLINRNNLNFTKEKLISDNLVDGNHFESVQIVPHSKEMINLYENHSHIELTASRYSMYPRLISVLSEKIVDVEAYNHLEEPEIISLTKHPFFLATGNCPQISSTREIPHPIIYTFMKASKYINQLDGEKMI
jgi:CTP synthase (UTP-ammonia lyase)